MCENQSKTKSRLIKKTKEELVSIIIEKNNALSSFKKTIKDLELKSKKYLSNLELATSMMDVRDETLKLERSNKMFYIKLLIASLVLNGVLLVISLL